MEALTKPVSKDVKINALYNRPYKAKHVLNTPMIKGTVDSIITSDTEQPTSWNEVIDVLNGVNLVSTNEPAEEEVIADNEEFQSNTPFGETISRLQQIIEDGSLDINTDISFESTFDTSAFDEAIANYGADVDTYVNATKQANNLNYRNNLQTNTQSVLNDLAARGMLNSSVTGDTLAQTMSTLATENAEANMLVDMQGAEFKLQIPELELQAASAKADADTNNYISQISLMQAQTDAAKAALAPYELLIQALNADMYSSAGIV